MHCLAQHHRQHQPYSLLFVYWLSLACGTLPLLSWSHTAPCLLCRPVCFTAESPSAGEGGHLQSHPQAFSLLFPLSLPKPPLSNESNLGSLQLPGLPSLSALTQCCGKCHSTKVICKSARERVAGGHCLCLSFQSAEGWICF